MRSAMSSGQARSKRRIQEPDPTLSADRTPLLLTPRRPSRASRRLSPQSLGAAVSHSPESLGLIPLLTPRPACVRLVHRGPDRTTLDHQNLPLCGQKQNQFKPGEKPNDLVHTEGRSSITTFRSGGVLGRGGGVSLGRGGGVSLGRGGGVSLGRCGLGGSASAGAASAGAASAGAASASAGAASASAGAASTGAGSGVGSGAGSGAGSAAFSAAFLAGDFLMGAGLAGMVIGTLGGSASSTLGGGVSFWGLFSSVGGATAGGGRWKSLDWSCWALGQGRVPRTQSTGSSHTAFCPWACEDHMESTRHQNLTTGSERMQVVPQLRDPVQHAEQGLVRGRVLEDSRLGLLGLHGLAAQRTRKPLAGSTLLEKVTILETGRGGGGHGLSRDSPSPPLTHHLWYLQVSAPLMSSLMAVASLMSSMMMANGVSPPLSRSI
ncbi:LOW QUALITY PROTEIN: hypothetical protein CRUP_001741 [Coryphaenoides rupestris]|nr:LOW QUALITY PROTEIN: hypothetical protein CRUP_001741 [Coryphaenoides rupestris]